MEESELKEILELHKKWLNNEEGGKRVDLRSVDLRYADLRYADLRYADLSNANLRSADLRYADLDFSCFPLWCGSFGIKVDDRLVSQLTYHICRLNIEGCSVEFKEFITSIPDNIKNKFTEYRIELPKISETKGD